MKNLNSYFIEHGLFDKANILEHCERHLVKVTECTYLPHVVVLHYTEECQFDKKWTYFSECSRGVVVDLKNKKLLATPFFKFRNLGEVPGPSYEECVKMGEFECSEKLDGSLGVVFHDSETAKMYVTTKGSPMSEHSIWATDWARINFPTSIQDPKFLQQYTLMFEIISPKFRIVIPYDRKGYAEGLYLIGVRHNMSEKLFSYKEVQVFANQHGLMTLKTYSFSSLDNVINQAKQLTFMDEGYVIRFKSNGLMLKIKSTDYLKIHRLLWEYSDDRVLEILQNNTEKELLEYLQGVPEEFSKDILGVIDQAKRSHLEITKEVYTIFADAPKSSRKEFALWVTANVTSPLRPHLFMLFSNEPVSKERIFHQFRKGTLPWKRETVSI